MTTYSVTIKSESGRETTIARDLTAEQAKIAAIKAAAEARDGDLVFVEFFRAADGQHGHLNSDGSHDVTGKAWDQEETATAIKTGYVVTDKGEILVQCPAENQFGFELCSDDQSWPGGIGAATSWTLIADDDPRITAEVRESLGWILEECGLDA